MPRILDMIQKGIGMQLDISTSVVVAFMGCLALFWLFLARYYWRRMRTFSCTCIGLCAVMLGYVSDGMQFEALARGAFVVTVIAVGLQIAWDGYKAQKRAGEGGRQGR